MRGSLRVCGRGFKEVLRLSRGGAAIALVLLLVMACKDDGEESGKDAATGEGDGSTSACADKTSPIKIGAAFALTAGGSARISGRPADQLPLFEAEVNRACGVGGDATGGVAVSTSLKDCEDSATLGPTVTQELIDEGAVAIIGVGGSPSTVPAAPIAIAAGIPLGVYNSVSDNVSGCTPEELADPLVTKTAEPDYGSGKCWDHKGLLFRTATTGVGWGRLGGQYLLDEWPALKAVSHAFRNDGFGVPVKDGFERAFEAGGGSVPALRGFEATATKEEFKEIIKELVATDPDAVTMTARVGQLKLFLEAYVELRKDWTDKPSKFDGIKIFAFGSLRSDYSDLSVDAIQTMKAQFLGIAPSWDADSLGFQRWWSLFQDFDPDFDEADLTHWHMKTYDALIVLALSMTKAGTTLGADVAAHYRAVANPPGQVVYPGEYAKARKLILEGADINYEGASGPLDFDARGNATGVRYELWEVDPADGTTIKVKGLGSPTE